MAIEPARAAAPTFSGCGKFAKDNPADASDPVADDTGGVPAEVEIEAVWIDAIATKPTLNLQIADLTGSVPPPATSITYDAVYTGVGETTTFVRAYLDFSGSVVYEYGHTEMLADTSTRYLYDGDTTGEMFPGQHGVVQIVIPPEAGGKAGTALRGVTGETQLGRTTVVPGAINQSPTRGLSFQDDTAALGAVTIGDCGAAAAPAPAPAPAAPNATPGTGAPSAQAAGPLPVKLATRSLKKAKAKKRVAVKLKATEALTKIGVRLSKGKTVYGTGKLSKLSGTGTVKFKLKKAIRKGTYAFDVAGTDANGKRRVASFKLRVR